MGCSAKPWTEVPAAARMASSVDSRRLGLEVDICVPVMLLLPVVRACAGVGLGSVSRDLETPSEEGIAMESLGRVVDLVHERLDGAVKVADLAAVADCSEGQLERRMKRVSGLTATHYVLRARVDLAAALLIDTETHCRGGCRVRVLRPGQPHPAVRPAHR